MRPELFQLFGVGFPAYVVLLVTGFLFATAAGLLWAKRLGHNPDIIVDLHLASFVAGIFGARILYVLIGGHFFDFVHMCTAPSLVELPFDEATCTSAAEGVWDAARAVCHPASRDCFAWAKFWTGGLTAFGALVGVSIAGWILLKRETLPLLRVADMASFTFPLALAFVRVGCFLSGCCFGSACDLPWAAVFPAGSPAALGSGHALHGAVDLGPSVPLHPTQIYESLGSIAIAIASVYVVQPRKRYDGEVFAFFLAAYGSLRFWVEAFRADARGHVLGITTYQATSAGMIASAIGMHFVLSGRAKRGRTAGMPDSFEKKTLADAEPASSEDR